MLNTNSKDGKTKKKINIDKTPQIYGNGSLLYNKHNMQKKMTNLNCEDHRLMQFGHY